MNWPSRIWERGVHGWSSRPVTAADSIAREITDLHWQVFRVQSGKERGDVDALRERIAKLEEREEVA